MRKKLVIGSIISVAFLYLALKDTNWQQLADALRATRWLYLIPVIGFTMLGHLARAYRWRTLLLPVKEIGIHSLFAATAIGFLANNVLPARLGEVVRAYVLGREEGISRTASFATIVFERVIDVFSLLALLAILLLRIDGPEWLRTGGTVLLASNVALLFVLFLAQRAPRASHRFVERVTQRLPHTIQARAVRMTEAFLTGLSVVRNPKAAFPIVAGSVAVWVFAMMGLFYCLPALSLQVPGIAAVALVVIVSMGTMIPSAPAYVGTTQYACIVALSLFDIPQPEALAFSLVYHATQFIPITLLGLYYLARTHIRWTDLSASGAR